MELTNAMSAFCSAIGSGNLIELARISLANQTGPANGSNVVFTFDLLSGPERTPIPRDGKLRRSDTRVPTVLLLLICEMRSCSSHV